MRIKAHQAAGYVEAGEGDCVVLTFTSTIHTPVMWGIAGTITARPGQHGVIVRRIE